MVVAGGDPPRLETRQHSYRLEADSDAGGGQRGRGRKEGSAGRWRSAGRSSSCNFSSSPHRGLKEHPDEAATQHGKTNSNCQRRRASVYHLCVVPSEVSPREHDIQNTQRWSLCLLAAREGFLPPVLGRARARARTHTGRASLFVGELKELKQKKASEPGAFRPSFFARFRRNRLLPGFAMAHV